MKDGFKKNEMVIIVGSSNFGISPIEKEMLINSMESFASFTKEIIKIGVTVEEAAEAFKAFGEIDYSKCEKFVFDSLTYSMPEFENQCYGESCGITKKAWKKLNKKYKRKHPEQKSQKEIWCNKYSFKKK